MKVRFFRSIPVPALVVGIIASQIDGGRGTVYAAEAENEVSAERVRVYFDDRHHGNQIFRSFEGAVIETDYEAQYHVMEMTPEVEERLLGVGLTYEPMPTRQTDREVPLLPDRALSTLSALETIPSYPCYETVEETFAIAEQMASNNPTIVDWVDIGDSWEKTAGYTGYDMMVLMLTNFMNTADKPKLFLTCSIHGREYATAPLCLAFAEQLVDGYGQEADPTWILDHHEVHIMLYANPDGRKQAEAGALWRKNTNEAYCGATSSNRGADINRNFDFRWGCCGGSSSSECEETFRGPYATSEPEAQAIQDYMRAIFPDQRANDLTTPAPLDATGVYIDVHSYSELVLYSWGFTDSAPPNGAEIATLGRKFAYYNGYTPEPIISLYATDGVTTDFCYGDLGVASYTFEIGTEFFQSCSVFENQILPDNLPALLYAAKVARTPYVTPSGPNARSLSLAADTLPPNTSVSLSAIIDDTMFNNSNGTEPTQAIAAAEYYVDTPPWVNDPLPTPVALSPADGTFDSGAEGVEGIIDTTGWSVGQHIVFVRGQDSDGHWGAFSAIFLTIDPESGCTDNTDCDDSEFCNGAEVCEGQICIPGDVPCAPHLCDESLDICTDGPLFFEDFENGNEQGWNLYATGSTASTGDWIIGDPNGTTATYGDAQPEDPFEGQGCAFTAQNSTAGNADVDGGVAYLVSPVIDLSGNTNAELSYVRWFYNGNSSDSGNYYLTDVSSDNGVTWVNLEALDDGQNENSWTQLIFNLEAYIPLTNTVRLRFGAADGTSSADIVEAAIDYVYVTVQSTSCSDDIECDDGEFCNGTETCDEGVCLSGGAPCPGALCDETEGRCVECLTPADCDDDLYCSGEEQCVDGSCIEGLQVVCNDGIACTLDSCNEDNEHCDNEPSDSLCDDGLFCNGEENCDGTADCLAGTDPCQGMLCDEGVDRCYECDVDFDCDDGSYCNGEELCMDGFCEGGSNPCPGLNCDENTDQCVDTPVFEELFESGNTQGWTLSAPGSTASTGNWIIGDPQGTVSGSEPAQPEDPFEGTGCVFTAQNFWLGYHDVDSGVVYLESPTINLGDSSTAVLSYVRWYFNRTLGGDTGDYFRADVSNDDGATWVNLETLDDNTQANIWTEMQFALESYVSLSDAMRLRFGASDGAAVGDIVESAIDNVIIWAGPGCVENVDCNDGHFCNGEETCVEGACQSGSDPCPGDQCDEGTDTCVECLSDLDCLDGLFCNGVETCDEGYCQPGIPVTCDDQIDCTVDACNEALGDCEYTQDDTICDDDLFCNGQESCDVQSGCQEGDVPCLGQECDEDSDSCYECNEDTDCDDVQFCNGEETCVAGLCHTGEEACSENQCDENTDSCVDCLSNADCDDGVACTLDTCVNGECQHDDSGCGGCSTDSECDDGEFCNGLETCANGVCEDGTSWGEACEQATLLRAYQNSGNFNTTDEKWFYVTDSMNGWWASNMSGRSIYVNGVEVSPSQWPLPDSINGRRYFQFTAGDFPWASWGFW